MSIVKLTALVPMGVHDPLRAMSCVRMKALLGQ